MLFDQGFETSRASSHELVNISLVGQRCRYSLRVRARDLDAFSITSGLQLPRRVGTSHLDQETQVFCLGPDEWFIVTGPQEGPKIRQTLEQIAAQFIFSLTDVSHRNIALTLTGPLASSAINAGCPLDLSLEQFPVGKVTRTVFEAAPIMLFRQSDEVFQLEFWRSYGPYVSGLLARVVEDIETAS